MTLEQRIIKTEQEFPKAFAYHIEKPYGILFYSEDNKNSHDSNHAIIYPEMIVDLGSVLTDITEFYTERNIIPHIYHPDVFGYFNDNYETFHNHGYEINIYGDYDMLTLQADNEIETGNVLQIKRVTEWDNRIADDIFIPNNEPWEIDVVKASICNSDNYVFVGYLENKACTVLYFHVSEYDCTRFDYVNTANEHRGKGYARQIHSYAVEFIKSNNLPAAYTWYANPISQKICHESGMRSLFKMPAGEAKYNTESELIN